MLRKKARILMLIETLHAGGKERRFIELLSYLKLRNNYEIFVVITHKNIQYPKFFSLEIPHIILESKFGKKDPFLFFRYLVVFFKFRPNIVHAWGSKVCFYSLPWVVIFRKPLINSQIADIFCKKNRSLFFKFISRINFYFSSRILANSKKGAESYLPGNENVRVIYNGINLDRFSNLPDKDIIKQKYGIITKYSIIMVARPIKNYDLFFKVGELILQSRNDISFIGVGIHQNQFKRDLGIHIKNRRIIFIENSTEVEALINACDIGVLFSEGEGISNAIIEYMALAKPVIASKVGGNVEIIENNETGYLIDNQCIKNIAGLCIDLIDNEEKRLIMGKKGQIKIHHKFTIERMGKEFDEVYESILHS